MKNKATCEECVYYRGGTHDYGYCKRHAPSISNISRPKQRPDLWWNEYCEWPNVHKENWCGDFVLKSQDTDSPTTQPTKEYMTWKTK